MVKKYLEIEATCVVESCVVACVVVRSVRDHVSDQEAAEGPAEQAGAEPHPELVLLWLLRLYDRRRAVTVCRRSRVAVPRGRRPIAVRLVLRRVRRISLRRIRTSGAWRWISRAGPSRVGRHRIVSLRIRAWCRVGDARCGVGGPRRRVRRWNGRRRRRGGYWLPDLKGEVEDALGLPGGPAHLVGDDPIRFPRAGLELIDRDMYLADVAVAEGAFAAEEDAEDQASRVGALGDEEP